ncbi:MAG: carotenoid 1,2-hydratase [Acidobacteria bacterium]|nr:carotenoid 1,2-hydratase [Acidobacteriota bacterium]
MRSCRDTWLVILWIASVAAFPQSRGAANEPSPQESPKRFCHAVPGYRFEFPRDHFSHPCFRTEWWYFTGNLTASGGRRFGFELTFFREGVDNPYPNPSRWRVDDLYAAHFAISDLGDKKFYYAQRLRRAGVELAGADWGPGRIWNGGWVAELRGQAWHLQAADGDTELRLELRPLKPPMIQGKHGVSQKAPGEGNASHYYSLTRLETSGELKVGGTSYAVSGLSWMDHEFATSQLEADQTGWDWISLQMEDGTEWMFYQFRRGSGKRDPYSSGSFVDASGRTVVLNSEDFQMEPLAQWTSPHSGARYPIRWRVRVPRHGFSVEVEAAMPDQELLTKETTGVIYWEGSITARGQQKGKSVHGRGYLEMTGYAGRLPGAIAKP